MMKKCLFVFALVIPIFSFALVHETLPSWHWANECIDALRLRGGFEELFELNRPYTRGQAAEALVQMRKREKDGGLVLSVSDKRLFKLLVDEFRNEIEEMQGKSDFPEPLLLGLNGQGGVSGGEETDSRFRGVYKSRIAVPLGKFGAAGNAVSMDQTLVDDPSYTGKKWRGMVGYTEQAYVKVRAGRFGFKLGRDFLRWGAGRNGSFLFSDVCRPLDQFTASADLGPLRYTFTTSALDKIENPAVADDSLGLSAGRWIYRFISAHRLDVKLLRGRFQAAVSELVLYGGPGRQFEWFYLNPAIFFHGEQMNEKGEGNTLGSVDILFYPVLRWQVYGSLLIDDIQIERTGSMDQEPSEIGWLAGSRIADPLNVPGLTLFGEYARVTNRTYKTIRLWETFIHRNVPLGHPLGNDFDRVQAGASLWINGKISVGLTYERIRRGEGSLFTPFDAPWMNTPRGKTYSEPFPTGTVEKENLLEIDVKIVLSPRAGLEGRWASSKIENAGHAAGVKTDGSFWRIGLWLDGNILFKM